MICSLSKLILEEIVFLNFKIALKYAKGDTSTRYKLKEKKCTNRSYC